MEIKENQTNTNTQPFGFIELDGSNLFSVAVGVVVVVVVRFIYSFLLFGNYKYVFEICTAYENEMYELPAIDRV